MIELRNVSKAFVLNGNRKVVANNLNLVVPDGTAIGILGRNGAGKSTLLKLLAGTMDPDSGEVLRTGSVSWPVGFAGSFHQELTGLQNTRFIARVYGVDSDELTNFVHHFSELGQHFYLPVRSYSSGMRSRLAFGISMGIPFDTYLVDEVTAVGDGSFKRKSEAVFAERLRSSAAVMVTHALGQVIRLCDHAAVLEQGTLHFYEDPREGVHHHQRLMQAAHPNA